MVWVLGRERLERVVIRRGGNVVGDDGKDRAKDVYNTRGKGVKQWVSAP